MEAKHTRGPWALFPVEDDKDYVRVRGTRLGERFKIANVLRLAYSETEVEEAKANARLIAAAPDLLAAQTMGASVNTPDFLDWVACRLVDVYGENPNVDFVLSLRERAQAGRAAIAKATGEQQ